jgi:Alw26I/Eco31I/Esp3I family type II restriction m6 adenine DNA methyltransferase
LFKKIGIDLEQAEKDLISFTEGRKQKNFFLWDVYFAEVFTEKGGFDIVIGNPPYAVSNDSKLRAIFQESIFGRPNLYGFFIHRSIKTLLCKNGVLTFINPRTLLADSYTSALRAFIIRNSRVVLILNITDRRKVFESVLQSTIVNIFMKTDSDILVRVKSIETKEELKKENEILITVQDFIYGMDNKIFIVAEKTTTYNIFGKLKNLKLFSDNGILFTTGKIQWDMYKNVLSDRKTKQSTLLIWAENIQRYYFASSKQRRDRIFINSTLKMCLTLSEDTIVVQRVTAVEQPRRIIASIVSPQYFGAPIQCENHTSYLESNKNKINISFILGLLNSNFFDFIFRHINSNTQVSAGELNALPFPSLQKFQVNYVIDLVNTILLSKQQNPQADTKHLEDQIDIMVYKLYELTYEEVKVIDPKIGENISKIDYEQFQIQ